MRYRVERERTDSGYGPGWVVMNAAGDVIVDCSDHSDAIRVASALVDIITPATLRHWCEA